MIRLEANRGFYIRWRQKTDSLLPEDSSDPSTELTLTLIYSHHYVVATQLATSDWSF